APYAAPEAWVPALDPAAQPMPADVYAFACLAFELLTSERLFDDDTPVAMAAAHRDHDGAPPRLRVLGRGDRLSSLAELLAFGLRRKPDARVSIAELRAGLARVAPSLCRMEWP